MVGNITFLTICAVFDPSPVQKVFFLSFRAPTLGLSSPIDILRKNFKLAKNAIVAVHNVLLPSMQVIKTYNNSRKIST